MASLLPSQTDEWVITVKKCKKNVEFEILVNVKRLSIILFPSMNLFFLQIVLVIK